MDFLDILKYIADWITTGIYQFFIDAIAYLLTAFLIKWLEFKLWGLQFAWAIAKALYSSIGANAQLQAAWGMLPSDVASACRFFHVPEAVNVLLTAAMTRFAMSFIPGI